MSLRSIDKLFLLPFVAAVLTVGSAAAQVAFDTPPGAMAEIAVVEHLDEAVDLDLEFQGAAGRVRKLREFFDGTHPVILSLNYSDCPMLCGLQLNGFVDCLKQMDMTPGDAFRVITVSIDPKEHWADAEKKRRTFIERLGKPEAAAGWSFLVGDQKNIKALADSVGFFYGYDADQDEYAHAAVMMVLTPDGRISRYLYGTVFEPKTVRLSLVEAADGKIGTTVDRFLLFCFAYDPKAGTYMKKAFDWVRIIGALSFVAMSSGLLFAWKYERKKHRVNSEVAA